MPFIILDRDGVINYDSLGYIKSADEWQPIPGSLEAIADLTQAGFKVIVITNQSGLARGLFDQAALDSMHAKFLQQLREVGGSVEAIFICPHHPEDHCDCRKPKPGLIKQAQAKYHFDPASTYLIGDKLTDVEAAKAAGCQPILVLTGKGQAELDQHPDYQSVLTFDNLAKAVEFILRDSHHEKD